MGGPSKVQIGAPFEEFPGRSFNLLVAEWYRAHAQLGRDTKSGGGPGQLIIAKARNTTGDTLQYGDCVALEGLAIPYADKDDQQYNRPLLKAQKHTSSLHHAIMGVSLRTVENNQPGPFIIAGAAWARVDVSDDAHHFAKLEEDQSTFSPLAISATSGYPILDSEEIVAPAEAWALVLLGGGSSVSGNEVAKAVVTSAAGASTHSATGISYGTTGTCILLDEDGASTDDETGAADDIEFKSLHRVGIPEGVIIELSAPNPIVAGSTWLDNKVVGRFADVVDELAERTGFGELKALAVGEADEYGIDPDSIEWLGNECVEET